MTPPPLLHKPTRKLFVPSVLFVLLVLVLGAVTFSALRPHDTPFGNHPQPATDPGAGATYAAEQFVKRHLKAPATARFSSRLTDPDSGRVRKTNGNWKAWGWVDSQNSFGANLRSKWYAVVRDAGDTWHPVFLRIGDEVLIGDTADFNTP